MDILHIDCRILFVKRYYLLTFGNRIGYKKKVKFPFLRLLILTVIILSL